MRILFLCNTAVAGSPFHLSKIINKYTGHESKTIIRKWFKSPDLRNLKWDYDMVSPTPYDFEKWINWSDIVVHNTREWAFPWKKAQCILYHSQPGNYVPSRSDPKYNGKKMVVAQYQARFYRDAYAVPNMIDIREHVPGPKSEYKVTVFMGVASETTTGWGRKGSAEVKAVCDKLADKFKGKFIFKYLKGRPIKEVYEIKKQADIVIDECITGSYHISSLEGLAFGAITFNNIDSECEALVKRITGASDIPFVKTNIKDLYARIEFFINNQDIMRAKQAESRKWIETYWDPKTLIEKYHIKFLQGVLLNYERNKRAMAKIYK